MSKNKPKPGSKKRWSEKYKKSIDCNNPKGFSQKQYCRRKKRGGNYKKSRILELQEIHKIALVPYEEFAGIRKFSSQIDSEELVWHRDEEDRKISVLSGNNWMLQFDNQLPIELKTGKDYFIKKNSWHRVIKGTDDLFLRINKIALVPGVIGHPGEGGFGTGYTRTNSKGEAVDAHQEGLKYIQEGIVSAPWWLKTFTAVSFLSFLAAPAIVSVVPASVLAFIRTFFKIGLQAVSITFTISHFISLIKVLEKREHLIDEYNEAKKYYAEFEKNYKEYKKNPQNYLADDVIKIENDKKIADKMIQDISYKLREAGREVNSEVKWFAVSTAFSTLNILRAFRLAKAGKDGKEIISGLEKLKIVFRNI